MMLQQQEVIREVAATRAQVQLLTGVTEGSAGTGRVEVGKGVNEGAATIFAQMQGLNGAASIAAPFAAAPIAHREPTPTVALAPQMQAHYLPRDTTTSLSPSLNAARVPPLAHIETSASAPGPEQLPSPSFLLPQTSARTSISAVLSPRGSGGINSGGGNVPFTVRAPLKEGWVMCSGCNKPVNSKWGLDLFCASRCVLFAHVSYQKFCLLPFSFVCHDLVNVSSPPL